MGIIGKFVRRKGKFPKVDLSQIRMFVTDSDGCLTDSGMYYSETGDELKKFSAYDGMAFRLLREAGIKTAIITGETRRLIVRRSEKLHVDFLEMGVEDKLTVLRDLCKKNQISLQQVVYIGDDVNDLECIANVGFGCCVSNGNDKVKRAARYITERSGGNGAVREVADLVLSAIERKRSF